MFRRWYVHHPLLTGRSLDVSSALWRKYDGNKRVTNVHVLHREVKPDGTLHTVRLLSAAGMMPSWSPWKPRAFHVLEG